MFLLASCPTCKVAMSFPTSVRHPVRDVARDKSTGARRHGQRRRRVGTRNLDWYEGSNGTL